MKGVTVFEKLRKIASEASYHYVLSRKLIKNAILVNFWNPEAYGQTVLPDR